jgi:hypothetical protein
MTARTVRVPPNRIKDRDFDRLPSADLTQYCLRLGKSSVAFDNGPAGSGRISFRLLLMCMSDYCLGARPPTSAPTLAKGSNCAGNLHAVKHRRHNRPLDPQSGSDVAGAEKDVPVVAML